MRHFQENRPRFKQDNPGGSGGNGSGDQEQKPSKPGMLGNLTPEQLKEAKDAFIPKGKPAKKPEPELPKKPEGPSISGAMMDRMAPDSTKQPPIPPASSETEEK